MSQKQLNIQQSPTVNVCEKNARKCEYGLHVASNKKFQFQVSNDQLNSFAPSTLCCVCTIQEEKTAACCHKKLDLPFRPRALGSRVANLSHTAVVGIVVVVVAVVDLPSPKTRPSMDRYAALTLVQRPCSLDNPQ